MTETARENFVLDKDTINTFRELAAAKGISKADFFRQLVNESATKNELLLKKWRELEKLRK